jgi:hypothetical protein
MKAYPSLGTLSFDYPYFKLPANEKFTPSMGAILHGISRMRLKVWLLNDNTISFVDIKRLIILKDAVGIGGKKTDIL